MKPIRKLNGKSQLTDGEKYIPKRAAIIKTKSIKIIRFRFNKSPKGIINNNPQAYPICVNIAILETLLSETLKSFAINDNKG